jgi:cyclopropane fatty-acyl-phospholipid synthase-like methyltransferase
MQLYNPKGIKPSMVISEEDLSWARNILFDNFTQNWCNTNSNSIYSVGGYFPPDDSKLHEKIAVLNFLKLKEIKPISILDIGTGAGHFIKLANSLGHNSIGTEIAESITVLGDVYNHYQLAVSELEIQKQKEIQLNSTFDIISTLRTTFNEGDIGELYYTKQDWLFLKDNIFNFLNVGGKFFIKTNLKLHSGIPQHEIFQAFDEPLNGWNSFTYCLEKT